MLVLSTRPGAEKMARHPDSKHRLAALARARLGPAALGFAALLSCSGAKPLPAVPGAASVVLSKDAPPASYVELRSLTAQSGKGCGVLGEGGSREDAEAKLRNDAQKLGAVYVHITDEQAPRPNHACLEHEYKLTGVAYRSANPAAVPPASTPAAPYPPAPASPPTPAPAPAPAAERVCTPGATQACLGPGACPGAQACRNDASGFLPCDCGPAPSEIPVAR